jgi:hypothetical protein
MQCEEDWAVMHALHQGHGWSIARIAREFDITWQTARRYVTAETVPRYRPRARPAELSQAQAAPMSPAGLAPIPSCGPRRCTGRSKSSAMRFLPLVRPTGSPAAPGRFPGRPAGAL